MMPTYSATSRLGQVRHCRPCGKAAVCPAASNGCFVPQPGHCSDGNAALTVSSRSGKAATLWRGSLLLAAQGFSEGGTSL